MVQVKKTPTIQDVARFAKVSTATVSRALSSPDRVSASTRERISDAVRETGYTLNQAARSLRQKAAHTILVALPDIRNTFFSTILDAIEREASARGYGVLVANLYLGQQSTAQLQHYLLSNRADGLLLLDGSLAVETLTAISRPPYAVPVVVACEAMPGADFPTVLTDNQAAAERATGHLIRLGHRHIGHIMGPERNIVARHRRLGFSDALRQAGLPERQDWVFPGSFEMESGLAAAQAYLRLTDRPSAVFATNDESAIGFLAGLRRAGLDCPRDISVVGFDDIEVAAHFSPPLTTMRQPCEELGRLAARRLLDLLEGAGGDDGAAHVVLPSMLIERQSTARWADAPAASRGSGLSGQML